MMQTEEILALLQEVGEQVVTPRFRALSADQVMEKNPGDLVTVADREAEVLITARLRAAYPGVLVVGEEAVAGDPSLLTAARTTQDFFTVDPIDGTKNFVHGSVDHAMMIGEVRGGQPVRAWIWQPEHRAAYVAERGSGAYRDGVRLERRVAHEPADGRTSDRAMIGRTPAGFEPLTLTWVSCGIDYPKLAAGECDYLLYRSVMPWDHVPGSLIVAEVGGAVGYLDGGAYDAGSLAKPLLAAATPELFESVRGALRDLR
ncbi:inositol monophosphatase [Allobranchiibius sp. GilTou38]|uniref:inositol monophosphatase family protein n=1 Tax=Allobranchiibius sp. GilTou38 TaxID=2815210 RepID=UPI001FB659F1|nr:inositol monophosphatase [Allobranchiibius sp. GilTou38]